MQKRFFLLMGVLVCLAAVAFGQSSTGTIGGSVRDAQGAVIPDASVTVTNQGTNRAIELKSNGDGLFTLPGIDPGPYKVEVKQPGFRTETRQVTLQTAQVLSLDFAMQPGEVSQVVEVTAGTPVVDTATSGVSDVVVGRQVTDLPLNGRNFTELASVVPGVTRGQPGNQQTGTGNQAETFRYASSGGGALSVNGVRVQGNNFLFDGIDNNESLVNTIVFFVPPDAIQEFRVDTNVAPAEYGRAGGGVVNATYKSGTNDWHGTVFWQLRNSALDANPNYFSPGEKKTLFHRNQFGLAGGGDIIKNKLFIFGDYQGVRQKLPFAGEYITVPTSLERTGDFSQLPSQLYFPGCGNGTPACAVTVANGAPAYNKFSSTAFVTAGQNYLNTFPLPSILSGSNPVCGMTGTDGSCLENNYEAHRIQTQNYNDFDARLDYVFSAKDQAFTRYSYGQDVDVTSSQMPTLPAGYGSGYQFQHPRSIVLGENHIFGTSLFNELRLGYVRSFLGYQPPFGGTPLSANLGIPNANTSPLLGGGALIGNSGSQISYTGDYGDYFVPENTYQIADNVSWIKGRHSFKFGANVIRRQVFFFNPIAGKGFFQASSSAPQSTGWEQSDMLVGWMNDYQVGPASAYFHTRSWENGFYGQDDFKLNTRLTLNLGLRYDQLTWPTEQNNRMANFNPATGAIELAGVNGLSDSTLSNDNHLFAPRIGFAYSLTSDAKTVLRGGYGIFYFVDREGIDKQMSQNAPFGGSSYYAYSATAPTFLLTLGGIASPLANGAPNISTINTTPMPSKGLLNISLTAPKNVSLTGWAFHDKPSDVQEWNLQLERQVDSRTAVTLAYVGTKGEHLSTFYDINRPFYDGTSSSDKPYPLLGTVPVNDTEGSSIYHGLHATVERHMSKGLLFTGAYTWAHAIDNSPAGFDSDYRYGGNVVDAFQWWTKERANSSLDVRHRLVFNALYELPFGRGRTFGSNWNLVEDSLIGGWEISPIVTLSSGFPFDVTCTYCYSPSTRPNLVGPLQQLNQPLEWFNTASFQKVVTDAGGVPIAPGDSPRNPFTGPGTKTLDFSIGKTFLFTERVKGRFTADFFNMFNTPQFSPPDGNINDGNFGKITALRFDSEREIQFGFRVSF